MSLLVSEPNIIDPVALAFDNNCQLYVVEMRDYPTGVPKRSKGGSIKLLTDTNGDGQYDRITQFASKLSYPTSVTAWKEGVLVAAPPNIIYLKDTNGDGISDIRKTLVSGFKLGVTDSNFNSLRWGIDNWIHGANGGNGGRIRFSEHNEPATSLRNLDFRIRPNTLQLETTSQTGGGFGLVFNEWGHSFTTYNIDYLQQRIIPQKYIDRANNLPSFEATKNISIHGKMARIFPIAEAETRVNHPEQAGYFSSAGGMGYLGIAGYPEDLSGSIFVCDVVSNLIHRNLLQPKGGAYIAKRAPTEKKSEFLASSDNYFRPVALELGPDGALYLADMQREVIEHPDYIPSKLKKKMRIRGGETRGRIYRITPKSKTSEVITKLEPVRLDNIEAEFSSPNQWRRWTAQRLIYESQNSSLVPQLRKLIKHNNHFVRLHALWSLQGLGAIKFENILKGLTDSNPRIRENTIRITETIGPIEDQTVIQKLMDLAEDPDSTVRFQLALTLGEIQPTISVNTALEKIYINGYKDEWTRKAVLCSLKENEVSFTKTITQKVPPVHLKELFQLTASRIAEPVDLAILIKMILNSDWKNDKKINLLKSLRTGLTRSSNLSRFKSLNANSLVSGSDNLDLNLKIEIHQLCLVAGIGNFLNDSDIQKIFDQTPQLDGSNIEKIKQYIRFISFTGKPSAVADKLLSLIKSTQDNDIQITAVNELANIKGSKLPKSLISYWPYFLPSVRPQLINIFVYNSRFKDAFLTALESKEITLGEANLDLEHRRELRRYSGTKIGNRAKKLFGDEDYSNRNTEVDKWLPLLPKNGNASKGSDTFKILCSNCHRSHKEGYELGPDLEGLNHRSVEDLASNIIDPNMAINPKYTSYSVITNSDDTFVGILSNQSANSITISMPLGVTKNINRKDIKELKSIRTSLMPMGLEKTMTPSSLRDVIEYIRQPTP
ncbi:MAG: PVC-type heme-binding CxxCH protein [Verrucomicrobiota bacterium]|nr:PVC-type heme-binding CxxCH protein [Verrucomicrobiota bacterium]